MLIGILLCGHAPDEYREIRGNIDDLFIELLDGRGFTFRTYAVVDMDFPASPDDADAWLITGSKHGVYEDLPFIPPMEAFIRDVRAAQKPLVGICFGHQLMAQALGGYVEKFEGGWNVGQQTYQMNGAEVRLNAWHQDQIIRLPDGAEVFGSAPTCQFAMLRYGADTISIQAHPELPRDYIEMLIEVRAGSVPQDQRDDARERLDLPNDAAAMADLIADTLTQRAPS